MYIFVGLLLGSLVTSHHDTKEACEGRRVTLAEKGVVGRCVLPNDGLVGTYYGSSIFQCGNGVCR